MKKNLFLWFFCYYIIIINSSFINENKKEIKEWNNINQWMSKTNNILKKYNLKDLSIKCAICGIVINEIEGMLMENSTKEEIELYLKNKFCSKLHNIAKDICINIANEIPNIIDEIIDTNSVSKICVQRGFCQKPFTPHPDPKKIPIYKINLDLPPKQRWKEICSEPKFQNITLYLIDTISSFSESGGHFLDELGRLINKYYLPKEYAEEIQGCSETMGISFGWATLMNLGYEISDACTSIVAQTKDNKILHARNMDFWEGMGFTESLREMAIQIEYQKGGKTLFHATTFAIYVGVLSGMKPKSFSLSINTRFYPDGLHELFYEIIVALVEKNASLVSFLTREVLTNENTFERAVDKLSNRELIADVYYIVGGISNNEGVIISRNRKNATDIWRLNSPSRWFEVQTNYDHWKQPPWFDNRVTPANQALENLGRDNLSLEGIMKVLSVKPVLNLQTTFTTLACPIDNIYQSYVRYCPYPCAE